MLNVVYFSNVTNTTARFVSRLNLKRLNQEDPNIAPEAIRLPIKDYKTLIQDMDFTNPYVLVTPSYGDAHSRGHLPQQVKALLNTEAHRANCVGVIGCGNRNFGNEYNMAAQLIAKKLNIPLLHTLELSGDWEDATETEQKLLKLSQQLQKAQQLTAV